MLVGKTTQMAGDTPVLMTKGAMVKDGMKASVAKATKAGETSKLATKQRKFVGDKARWRIRWRWRDWREV